MSGRLVRRAVVKPWGRNGLGGAFAEFAGRRVGEVWFEPPAAMVDILVKYIFADEALSIQVHPSNAQTMVEGLGRQGKEECWLVIDAEPGASLGIGFHAKHDVKELRAAALDGSIECLMCWHPVGAGDFFYIPAGTVHAIGAGITLLEVQQASGITWRLYDYGRPRELHLDKGLAVARREPYPRELRRRAPLRGGMRLVDGSFFRLDLIEGGGWDGGDLGNDRPALLIPLAGEAEIDGDVFGFGACGLWTAPDEVRFGGDFRGLVLRAAKPPFAPGHGGAW